MSIEQEILLSSIAIITALCIFQEANIQELFNSHTLEDLMTKKQKMKLVFLEMAKEPY